MILGPNRTSRLPVALFAAVLVVAATPLVAQQPKPDSATLTILRIATADTAEGLAIYRTASDTVWPTVVDPRTPLATAAREVRLERRRAAAPWERMSEKPVRLTPPSRSVSADTVGAPAMQPQPAPKRKHSPEMR